MNTETKISVITPSYNRAHTLERVYESLKNQIYKDFVWIIMDDGSTDNTRELVDSFIKENKIQIEYFYNRNRHKFITVFEGIKKVETPYFVVMDSDDTRPSDSLQILLEEVSKIENKEEFIAIMGNSEDEKGNLVGNPYPGNGFIGSIFEMRYKFKVRGDKNGIFITDSYKKELANYDYSPYEGKGYIPQSVFFNIYDAKGLKTKFINKVVRIYHKDDDDENSVSNTRWTGKNIFGLREGYKSFLNNYGNRLLFYPKSLLRNIIGFQFYSFMNKVPLSSFFKELKNPTIKILSIFILPFSYMYFLMKK